MTLFLNAVAVFFLFSAATQFGLALDTVMSVVAIAVSLWLA